MRLNKTERAAVMRIMADMVKADGIIDYREMEALHELMQGYGVTADDKALSATLTLAQAVRTVRQGPASLPKRLMDDVNGLAMSDRFCAREEALLLIALTYAFNPQCEASIVSIAAAPVFFPTNQMLYVESAFDAGVNAVISNHLREIVAQTRLAGFDFVYIPHIVDHYRQLPDDQLQQMVSFLYPQTGEARLQASIQQLKGFTTADFCHDLLSSKLKVSEIDDTPPALMVKIGSTLADGRLCSDYLLLELGDDALGTLMDFIDRFNSLYQTMTLAYLLEEPGRFIFRGFYRQLLQLVMLKKGIRSSVLVDTVKGEIIFPEADIKVSGLHRREKALYALALLESPAGGLRFAKPEGVRHLDDYQRRMAALQQKYDCIYQLFGGDKGCAPRIDVPETRSPMLSLINRQINKLGDVLYHIDDYLIKRNAYANYEVKLPPAQCLYRGFGQPAPQPMRQSPELKAACKL